MKKVIFCFKAILIVSFFLISCDPTELEPEEPQISVQPNSLAFTKTANSDILIISNSGSGELSWEIADKPDWLEASKGSGKITTGTDTIIASADVNQATGTYAGTINITSNGGNNVVPVFLNTSEFPTGLFKSDEVQNIKYRFNNNGTFILYWNDAEYVTGVWSVQENQFYTNDDWGECQTVATYEWTFDGVFLFFQAIEDYCNPRINNMDGKTWKLVEGS